MYINDVFHIYIFIDLLHLQIPDLHEDTNKLTHGPLY